MIEVIPGIIEQDLVEIEKKLRLIAPYVSWVHFDFADNTLVPNQTNLSFNRLGKLLSAGGLDKNLSAEAHLMVLNPAKYIKPLADAGFKRLSAHIEANDPRSFLDEAKFESVEVGLAIDGPTEFELLEPYLDEIDFVHVMTIEAGFSGQPFLPEAVDKIRIIRRNLPDLPIAVDGGINGETRDLVVEAGATRLIVTSYFYEHANDIARTLRLLKGS